MKRKYYILAASLAGLAFAGPLRAESLRIAAPTVLPRGCPLVGYSPLVKLHYSGLGPENYTVKVWLLETGNYFHASSQWSERTFAIENRVAEHSEGDLLVCSPMDVFDYPSFLWVARLYNGSGVEVGSSTVPARGVKESPPLLERIGKRVATAGQPFKLTASAVAAPDALPTFRLVEGPAGAQLDPKTGALTWRPSAPGVARFVVEALAPGAPVADAEVFKVEVTAADDTVAD
jgi:hypothetical protein